MAKATSKKTVVTEPIVEQPKEETVLVGQTAAGLNEEMKLVEVPKSEAIEKGLFKEPIGRTMEQADKDLTEKGFVKVHEWASGDLNDLSMEDKIVNFITSRSDGEIKLNDFLKSLYPFPKFNEPAVYLQQAKAKELKGVLAKLEREGKVSFVGNGHTKLGKFYYEGNETVTKYHNILTVQIVVKK